MRFRGKLFCFWLKSVKSTIEGYIKQTEFQIKEKDLLSYLRTSRSNKVKSEKTPPLNEEVLAKLKTGFIVHVNIKAANVKK